MSGLDAQETARWTAWKRAGEAVGEAVVREIQAATGLSGPDFAVLTRVVELGDGVLRQQRLADLLGWERSRLSRQVSRMADRGLLVRTVDGAVRQVTATPAGRDLVRRARPVHAAAVRRALLTRVSADAAATFWAVTETLAAGSTGGELA